MSHIIYAIDLAPIEMMEDLTLECVQPCNRFVVNYDASNLTADFIDSFNGEILDYVFITVRDADCNLIGTRIVEFRNGSHSFSFVSTIGRNVIAPKKFPLTAYFVDIESMEDLPLDENIDELFPFLSIELLDDGTFNRQHLPRDFPTPFCSTTGAMIFSYGDKEFNEQGKDLIQLPDGEFLLAGFAEAPDEGQEISGINNNVRIVRLQNGNEQLWNSNYGGLDQEGYQTELDELGDIDVMEDVDGNFIIATTSFPPIPGDTTGQLAKGPHPWIFKLNDFGEILWESRILGEGTSVFHDMVPNPSGGCYVSFSSASPSYTILNDSLHTVASFGMVDIGVASIDTNGEIQWLHTVGDQFRNLQSSIDVIDDNSLIVLYDSESNDGKLSSRLDASGNISFNYKFGKDPKDGITEVKVLEDETYIAAGYTFGEFSFDLKLVRYNDQGILWEKQYDTPFDDYIFSMFAVENNEILLAGESSGAVLFMLIDDNGNQLSKKRIVLENEADFGSVIKIDEGFALTGTIVNNVIYDENQVGEGRDDFYLTILDANLDFVSSQSTGLSGSVKNVNDIGVPDVEVRLSDGQMTMTDSEGNFTFDEIIDFTNLSLNFEKDDGLQNGLSSVDLVQILNHIIGILPFDNQLQISSADLNNDGSVSSADLIILRNAILGFITELPNGTPLWRFSQNHIPITSIPDSPINIIANKVGDVNGDAIN